MPSNPPASDDEEPELLDLTPELIASELENLEAPALRKALQKFIDAGVADSKTFTPVLNIERSLLQDKAGVWSRHRISKHIFDMPDTIANPTFLAQGGYGCVARAWYQGREVAVKKIPVAPKTDEEEAVRLLREIAILQKAKEENQKSICEVIEVYGNAGAVRPNQLKHYYIVMPLYWPGCLEDFEVKCPKQYKTIATHTLQAVHWLHKQRILHRDIKRENIFYNAETDRAVLGDLGTARRYAAGKMSGKKEVGTMCYLAPEFLLQKPYSYPSDIWSLGCVWWEMLTHKGGDCLFPGGSIGGKDHIGKARALCSSTRPNDAFGRWAEKKWRGVKAKEAKEKEKSYERIFKKIFVFDSEERGTIEDLYADPYFADSRQDVREVKIMGVDLRNYDSVRSYLFYSQTLQGRIIAASDTASISTCTGTIASIPSDCVSVASEFMGASCAQSSELCAFPDATEDVGFGSSAPTLMPDDAADAVGAGGAKTPARKGSGARVVSRRQGTPKGKTSTTGTAAVKEADAPNTSNNLKRSRKKAGNAAKKNAPSCKRVRLNAPKRDSSTETLGSLEFVDSVDVGPFVGSIKRRNTGPLRSRK